MKRWTSAQLSNQIIKGVILPEFVILALVWLALARGLSLLAELQRRIRARRPKDLSPIDSGQVPEEISPLVASLNDTLERLPSTIRTQKRFIADAAHQMKTPLAGMRMQSELALRQTDMQKSTVRCSSWRNARKRRPGWSLSCWPWRTRKTRARSRNRWCRSN